LKLVYTAFNGNTASLFISQVAFANPTYIEQAKLGILLASFVSTIIGLIWLYGVARNS
jgi:NhaA family Na+:H+ antiporter